MNLLPDIQPTLEWLMKPAEEPEKAANQQNIALHSRCILRMAFNFSNSISLTPRGVYQFYC